MGISKTEHFTEEQNEVAKLMKALSHPARIAIVEYLLSVDSCICNDIVDEIKLAQPTVSQHLKELKEAGLIQGEIETPKVRYCINRENWELARKLFTTFLGDCQCKGTSCCE